MRRKLFVPLALATLVVPLAAVTAPVQAAPTTGLARSPELTVTTRLADRRSFVIGTRFWQTGAEDGTYPATGFHTRGEMGGFWSMPIKLLDGVWFKAGGRWLQARAFTQGWGYTRMDLGSADGVRIRRTDVAPDGLRAGLIGLTLSSPRRTTLNLTLDAHSELMSAYPWGETTPNQKTFNLQDTGSVSNGRLVFRDRGTSPGATAAHDYAAVVGSTLTPNGSSLGRNHRGPQDPAVICPESGANTPAPPTTCDDTAYGKGTGGQLRYRVDVPAGSRTVWFAVSGSDKGLGEAQSAQRAALTRPADLLRTKVAERLRYDRRTAVSLPDDPLLARSIRWSKQNLLDSRQQARDLQLRVTNAGTKYPAPVGTLDRADWIGAGWPDYTWIFATDGEYTNFAAVAAGQFGPIERHLRTLKNISEIVNKRSGKVVHEVTPDGSVFFGANSDDGNTDETVKFPSAVALVWRWTGDNEFRDDMYDFAIRNMKYATTVLDQDKDGWPEGAGNVELKGMGAEKLDNAVYTIRGLLDLADMARSKGDSATASWATTKANGLLKRFESTWWYGGSSRSYADSLENPDNTKLFQRHWIGLVPAEAELPATGTTPARPVASTGHGRTTLKQHERPCFTGTNGLYHTGYGPTSASGGNTGPSCDTVVSSLAPLPQVFTLTTSIAAVAEAAMGRTAQSYRYSDDIARTQLDPRLWEAPGMMPEIVASPGFDANIDQPYYTRSMGLQAWGTYGVLWPTLHLRLGISPDLGRRALSVVPQGAGSVRDVRLGSGSADVAATRTKGKVTTRVVRHDLRTSLTIGAVMPAGAKATTVTLNGRKIAATVRTTARGTEVVVAAGGRSDATLVVRYR
ncbi:glucosidase family protein [Jatrophihabitans fulvus]